MFLPLFITAVGIVYATKASELPVKPVVQFKEAENQTTELYIYSAYPHHLHVLSSKFFNLSIIPGECDSLPDHLFVVSCVLDNRGKSTLVLKLAEKEDWLLKVKLYSYLLSLTVHDGRDTSAPEFNVIDYPVMRTDYGLPVTDEYDPDADVRMKVIMTSENDATIGCGSGLDLSGNLPASSASRIMGDHKHPDFNVKFMRDDDVLVDDDVLARYHRSASSFIERCGPSSQSRRECISPNQDGFTLLGMGDDHVKLKYEGRYSDWNSEVSQWKSFNESWIKPHLNYPLRVELGSTIIFSDQNRQQFTSWPVLSPINYIGLADMLISYFLKYGRMHRGSLQSDGTITVSDWYSQTSNRKALMVNGVSNCVNSPLRQKVYNSSVDSTCASSPFYLETISFRGVIVAKQKGGSCYTYRRDYDPLIFFNMKSNQQRRAMKIYTLPEKPAVNPDRLTFTTNPDFRRCNSITKDKLYSNDYMLMKYYQDSMKKISVSGWLGDLTFETEKLYTGPNLCRVRADRCVHNRAAIVQATVPKRTGSKYYCELFGKRSTNYAIIKPGNTIEYHDFPEPTTPTTTTPNSTIIPREEVVEIESSTSSKTTTRVTLFEIPVLQLKKYIAWIIGASLVTLFMILLILCGGWCYMKSEYRSEYRYE
ncbi:ORF105 [Haliotid herpesvirus 1]|uniref:Glycoprotein n=1 Tax=Abalone herpesvirus Taiwan/2005 TaxID=1821058 RepID=A0A145VVZ9_9VIRU|nr:hypothetical protein tc2005_p125c [Abalone herpesvirus Taiwan/2005]UCX57096.1 ORF105 [Haliotid herpesvirus 1]